VKADPEAKPEPLAAPLVSDPELAALVERWPQVDAATRQAILRVAGVSGH
jgi:hypothetical protein